MNGRCLIFCSMPPGEAIDRREGDFVIACDKGALYARQAGILPDLLIGDFDSWDGELAGIEKKRFPVEKDDTDSMLAVREGLSRGFSEFILFGALGGRLDHTLANLQTLLFLGEHGASGMLVGEGERITMVQNGSRLFLRRAGVSFSVLAFGGTARGVTLEGTYYPLQNGVLTERFPLGHGNRITAEAARVTVTDGTLFVIESRLD